MRVLSWDVFVSVCFKTFQVLLTVIVHKHSERLGGMAVSSLCFWLLNSNKKEQTACILRSLSWTTGWVRFQLVSLQPSSVPSGRYFSRQIPSLVLSSCVQTWSLICFSEIGCSKLSHSMGKHLNALVSTPERSTLLQTPHTLHFLSAGSAFLSRVSLAGSCSLNTRAGMWIPRRGLLHVGITSRNVRAPPTVTHCFHDDHSGEKLQIIPRHLQEVAMMTPTLVGKKKKKTHGVGWWLAQTHTHTQPCVLLFLKDDTFTVSVWLYFHRGSLYTEWKYSDLSAPGSKLKLFLDLIRL